MNYQAIALNLIFIIPPILLLTAFIYFFYRAIRHAGLERLKNFTIIILSGFAILIVLIAVVRDVFSILPLNFVHVAGNQLVMLTLTFGLMIYFVLATIKIHKENNARFLYISWLIIFLFNVADLAWQAYLLLTWEKKPVVLDTGDGAPLNPAKLIMEHVRPRPDYFIRMFYPFCWVIVSSISLLKIRKEKRNLALQTPS
jgi:hypothetical protein